MGRQTWGKINSLENRFKRLWFLSRIFLFLYWTQGDVSDGITSIFFTKFKVGIFPRLLEDLTLDYM